MKKFTVEQAHNSVQTMAIVLIQRPKYLILLKSSGMKQATSKAREQASTYILKHPPISEQPKRTMSSFFGKFRPGSAPQQGAIKKNIEHFDQVDESLFKQPKNKQIRALATSKKNCYQTDSSIDKVVEISKKKINGSVGSQFLAWQGNAPEPYITGEEVQRDFLINRKATLEEDLPFQQSMSAKTANCIYEQENIDYSTRLIVPSHRNLSEEKRLEAIMVNSLSLLYKVNKNNGSTAKQDPISESLLLIHKANIEQDDHN